MPPFSVSALIIAKENPLTTTSFGIISKDEGGLKDKWLVGSNTVELSEDECDNEELYFACNATEDVFSISVIDIESIIKNAVNLTEIAKNVVKKSGKSPTFSYHMMSFMCDVPSMFFHRLDNDTNENKIKHKQRSNDVLNTWGMCKVSIDGDGNCCFNAVAFSILNNFQSFNDDYKVYLETFGLNIKANNAQEVSLKLRELTVAKWLENSSSYQEFLPEINIHAEATKFLSPRYYYEDLADTMILAMSNVLNATTIVFSSIKYHPIICVTPRKTNISIPILVAFTQFGSGHYDGVIEQTTGGSYLKQHKGCSCGKNDKKNESHCHEITFKYTTAIRCECLKNKQSCTELYMLL